MTWRNVRLSVSRKVYYDSKDLCAKCQENGKNREVGFLNDGASCNILPRVILYLLTADLALVSDCRKGQIWH